MGNNKTTKTNMFLVITVYTVIFYAAWALVEIVVNPALVRTTNSEDTAEFIREILIKNVIWTIPAILLVKRYKENVRIPLKEMFTTKVKWLKYVPLCIVFTVYILGQKYLLLGNIALNKGVSFAGIILYLFVGECPQLE